MDQEFTNLVNQVVKSEMSVEILFEALRTMQQSHSYTSPKLALQIGISEWDK